MTKEIERMCTEVEELLALLQEARAFIVPSDDAGCTPGECSECDMHRLAVRIDAALKREGE